MTKGFSPASFVVGGSTTLSFTVANPAGNRVLAGVVVDRVAPVVEEANGLRLLLVQVVQRLAKQALRQHGVQMRQQQPVESFDERCTVLLAQSIAQREAALRVSSGTIGRLRQRASPRRARR